MDYKKEIVKMIGEINNLDYLMKIYYFAIVFFRKERER